MLIWQQKILRVFLSWPLPNRVTQKHEFYWVSVSGAAVFCLTCLLPCPPEAVVWLISDQSNRSALVGLGRCFHLLGRLNNHFKCSLIWKFGSKSTAHLQISCFKSFLYFYVLSWRTGHGVRRGHQMPALRGFVSCYVGARNQTQVLHDSIHCSSPWAMSPALQPSHSLVWTSQG